MSQLPPQFPQGAPPPPRAKSNAGWIIAAVVGGVLIVGLLCSCLIAGIMLPALGKARQSARQLKSSVQLRTIGMGLMAYAGDNKDWLPEDGQTWVARLSPKYAPASEFEVPYDHTATNTGGYIYIPPRVRVDRIKSPAEFVLVYESTEVFQVQRLGGNILFADGHVDYVKQPLYQKYVDALKAGKNPPMP